MQHKVLPVHRIDGVSPAAPNRELLIADSDFLELLQALLTKDDTRIWFTHECGVDQSTAKGTEHASP
jgi:hypothetical protein